MSTGAVVTAGVALPWRSIFASPAESVPFLDPSTVQPVVTAALDAARSAGAVYADVHLRVTQRELWIVFQGARYPYPTELIHVGIGVRALVNGYWGFAGRDSHATVDVGARLGRAAAEQAKSAATGKPRVVELARAPVVTGTWVMPVQVDPFIVPFEEKADFMDAISNVAMRQRIGTATSASLVFLKEVRTFGSSEGSFTTQTVYRTQGSFSVTVPADGFTEDPSARDADFLTPAGAGWEYVRHAPFQERLPHLFDDALRARRRKAIDVGRYDVVFDAKAMANVLDRTIGMATGLERAMGYDANEDGTSYLNDPLAMLGTLAVGSPLVNISANRSMPGGAATVQWDAEGVVPSEATLINKGVLTDFQTTRESASWLAPYYQKIGVPIRSNGCAGIQASSTSVTPWSPNLVLAPSPQEMSFEALVKQAKKGYAVVGGTTSADQQLLNGYGQGEMVYEITDGALGSVVSGAEYVFRAPEFWKGVSALGGSKSARSYGFERVGEYAPQRDSAAHTISAVPALITGVAMVDATRNA